MPQKTRTPHRLDPVFLGLGTGEPVLGGVVFGLRLGERAVLLLHVLDLLLDGPDVCLDELGVGRHLLHRVVELALNLTEVVRSLCEAVTDGGEPGGGGGRGRFDVLWKERYDERRSIIVGGEVRR